MIGELSEKGVHNSLKNYLEPNKNNQEIRIGKYIADIVNNKGIIEIQTKSFKKLIPKLDYYISEKLNVKIVYPLEVTRYIVRKDMYDNVISERKAPHRGVKQDILYEIYWLLGYLDNPYVSLSIIEVDVKDYRDSRNNKLNRELVSIGKEYIYDSKESFVEDMIPYKGEFTIQDFYRDTKLVRRKLNPLKCLVQEDLIKVVGKQKNKLLYKKEES